MTGEAPQALKGFYGEKNRKQEILTPGYYLDQVREFWPEGIALDPCSAPGSLVNAKRSLYVPPTVLVSEKTGKERIVYEAKDPSQDGLNVEWEPFTFCNPPYAFKKDWLGWATAQYAGGLREIVLLVQVALRRPWFREACIMADDICWMDPLTFEGYPSSFPADLCTLYYGERKEAFRKAFNCLGDCACFS